MKSLMNVEEVRDICKNRTKWRFVVSVNLDRKK